MNTKRIDGLTSYKRKVVQKLSELVAEEYGLEIESLMIKSNSAKYSVPRSIAVGILREIYNIPLRALAEYFNYKHHASVIYAVKVLNEKAKTEKDVRNLITRIIKEVDKEIKP